VPQFPFPNRGALLRRMHANAPIILRAKMACKKNKPLHQERALLKDQGLSHLLERCSEVTANNVERRVDFRGKALHSSH
jgi:hypothetical protein